MCWIVSGIIVENLDRDMIVLAMVNLDYVSIYDTMYLCELLDGGCIDPIVSLKSEFTLSVDWV